MNFRRKLLLVFALTVFLSVAAVAWLVSTVTRRAFEQSNEAQTAALVGQFQRQFEQHADEVVRRVEAIAASEARIAVAVVNPRQARDFARATGKLAKTDRIDA